MLINLLKANMFIGHISFKLRVVRKERIYLSAESFTVYMDILQFPIGNNFRLFSKSRNNSSFFPENIFHGIVRLHIPHFL